MASSSTSETGTVFGAAVASSRERNRGPVPNRRPWREGRAPRGSPRTRERGRARRAGQAADDGVRPSSRAGRAASGTAEPGGLRRGRRDGRRGSPAAGRTSPWARRRCRGLRRGSRFPAGRRRPAPVGVLRGQHLSGPGVTLISAASSGRPAGRRWRRCPGQPLCDVPAGLGDSGRGAGPWPDEGAAAGGRGRRATTGPTRRQARTQAGRTGQDRWPAPSQAKRSGLRTGHGAGGAAGEGTADRAPRPRPPTQEPGRAVEPWLPAPGRRGRHGPRRRRGRGVAGTGGDIDGAPEVGPAGRAGGFPSAPCGARKDVPVRHPADCTPGIPGPPGTPAGGDGRDAVGPVTDGPLGSVPPSAGTSGPGARRGLLGIHRSTAVRGFVMRWACGASRSRPCPSAPAPPRTRSTRPHRPGSRRRNRSVRRGPSRRGAARGEGTPVEVVQDDLLGLLVRPHGHRRPAHGRLRAGRRRHPDLDRRRPGPGTALGRGPRSGRPASDRG